MLKDELWDDSDACQVCGKTLPEDQYWGIRKYCGKSCNAKAYRLRHLERIRREQRLKQRRRRQAEADAAPPRYCACGAVIPNWTRRDKIWCTPLCSARGGRIGNGICEGCGARFKPRGISKRYCTPQCQKQTWLARKEAEAGIDRSKPRYCVGCGVLIPATAPRQRKWCKRSCYHRVWRERQTAAKSA